MLKQLHRKKLFLPTLIFVPTLCCLLLLGRWQLDRKHWKEELLSAISLRTASLPQDLEIFLKKHKTTQTQDVTASLDYYSIRVRGSFLHDKELYLYAPDPNLGAGYHVYTPLMVNNTDTILIVNRGYVPENKKDPQSRKEGQISGEVEITGLLRSPGKQGLFVPDNNPAQNLWFWRDLGGMIHKSFKDPLPKTYPFFLETLQEASGGLPKGRATLLEFPNRHLEYAITWFGLAFVLSSIYVLYVLSCIREANKISTQEKTN